MAQAAAVVTVAICGFGRAGKMHFTTIRKSHRCKLKYIVDISSQVRSIEEHLKEWNLSQVKVVVNEEAERIVLADSEVQGIIVTTPTYTHEEYVCKALKHGKGVFCEKPVAESLPAVLNCYEMARKAELPLLCAFNRRFDPAFCSVKEQVQNGAIGKIHSIKTVSRDSPLPSIEYLKISNGFFHDSSVHDIDVICWILGEDPVEVYAQAHGHHPEIRDIPDFDTAAIVMKFPSGVVAIIDQSRHSSYGYDQRVEVFGEKGMLTVDNFTKTPVTIATKEGIAQTPYVHSFPTRYAEAYHNELMHFLDAINDPSVTLKVTKEDAVRANKVASACHVSVETKQAQVFQKN